MSSEQAQLKRLQREYQDAIAPHEDFEQSMLVQWAQLSENKYPELKLLYAIPNGGGFSGGFKANVVRVQRLKRTGLRAGVPDLCLPVARHGFHSLYIEMKRVVVRANTSLDQKVWILKLREAGHKVEVCRGYEEAKSVILEYLSPLSPSGHKEKEKAAK